MSSLRERLSALDSFKALRSYLPTEDSRPAGLEPLTRAALAQRLGTVRVLDLGCGDGNSIDFFRALSPSIQWHGVDLWSSPEVDLRSRTDGRFASFDGQNLPYDDASFDLVYSRQVLEHVRCPDALIADTFRVLVPGGVLVGSVSYLEPLHSFSIFNFTPYGLVCVLRDAGFEVRTLLPGVDAGQLMLRQLLNRARLLRTIWARSPFYAVLAVVSRVARLDARHRNFLKLQFAGHIIFEARRPDGKASR